MTSTYTPQSRWGHGAVYQSNPPSLLIQGGKTDPTSSYTYTDAPNSGDLISLALTSTFSTSSPPFSLLNASGPTNAWHTLASLSTSTFLSFGGDGGPSEILETEEDSAWTFDITNTGSNFTQEPTGWGSQPERRIYHSSAATQSNVFISGGLRDDGSGQAFSDVYNFDISTQTFLTLPALPAGLYHHKSVILSNGTLVLLGGLAIAPTSGDPAILDLSVIYVLDTTAVVPTWDERNVGGAAPTGRRGATMVLNEETNVAFMFGGANSDLTVVMNDAWNLDLNGLTWSQEGTGSQGPSGRFDHSAIDVGGAQVMLYGGYGASAPADSNLYIWNTASNSWTTTYSPASSASTTTNNADTAPAPDAITAYDPSGGQSTATMSMSISDSPPGSGISGSSGRSGTATPSIITMNSSGGPGQLTPSAKVAIALGCFAVVALAAGAAILSLCRRRRQRRRKVRFGATEDTTPPAPSNPYGPIGKSGPCLLKPLFSETEKTQPTASLPPSTSILRALGARVATLGRNARRPSGEQYAVLRDVGDTPNRHSTRRDSDTIRLIGSRSPGQMDPRAFTAALMSPSRSPTRGQQSPGRYVRRSMLSDEDLRRFPTIPEEDWVVPDEDEKKWKTAPSLLGEDDRKARDPFADDQDEDESRGPSPPKMRLPGGPVPTPHDSRSDLDPFDDTHHRLSAAMNDDLLLPPPALRPVSDSSLPRSQHSRSTSASDLEEGIVGRAQLGSHRTPTLYSPESEYEPIKRTESFFRRMTAGGISSIILRQSPTKPALEVRDPNPNPTLWPIISRDAPNQVQDDRRRPEGGDESDRSALLEPPQPLGEFRASLSSLSSARSMRDMVIVQRDDSELGSPVFVETADIASRHSAFNFTHQEHPPHRLSVVHHSDDSNSVSDGSWQSRHRVDDRNGSSDTFGRSTGPLVEPPMLDFGGGLDLSFNLHHSLPRGGITDDQSEHLLEYPKAPPPTLSPPRSPESPSRESPDRRSTPEVENSAEALQTLETSEIESPATNEEADTEFTPSPSPRPSPFGHRRPVKDVVKSLNKRGGATPLSLFSPASNYSTATPVIPSPLPKATSPVKTTAPLRISPKKRSSQPPISGEPAQASPISAGPSLRRDESIRSIMSQGSGSPGRPQTIYEAVKRQRLSVANPDAKRWSS